MFADFNIEIGKKEKRGKKKYIEARNRHSISTVIFMYRLSHLYSFNFLSFFFYHSLTATSNFIPTVDTRREVPATETKLLRFFPQLSLSTFLWLHQ